MLSSLAPMLSPLAWSLLLGTAAALANILGGLAVVSRQSWSEEVLKYFVALGAGFMLAATFLRMLPESFKLTPQAPLLVLGGLLPGPLLRAHGGSPLPLR